MPVYSIEVTDQLLRVAYDLNLMPTLRTLSESLTSRISDVNDLNKLQVRVKEKLSKNRFLIVLDDVWNENYNHCMTLLSSFEVGSVESKIIVTTSNQRVASMSRLKFFSLVIYKLSDPTKGCTAISAVCTPQEGGTFFTLLY
ncbi:NBS-LRR resistance-like protein [Gossypium australe]|uniref:NBS-LRR resistance-like protein n=1 Tax=Gossypium australe TaxID=47621 RepID=A0A5B6VKG2_9ROSI|nr:NBS-LRR resistance-like protein [Gossypium australe]